MSINKTITTIPIKNILSHVKKPFGPPGSDRFCSFFYKICHFFKKSMVCHGMPFKIHGMPWYAWYAHRTVPA